jgi:hypothetical protein
MTPAFITPVHTGSRQPRAESMGYLFAMGVCVGCRNLFSFNPDLVPSIVVNGEREPVCLTCVRRVNPARIANGLEPIRPLPGAYAPVESI